MSDTFKDRVEQAVATRKRTPLGPGASHEDIVASFKRHDLIEPSHEKVSAALAEVVTVDAVELHRWYLVNFAPRLAEKVARGCSDRGWVFACPKQKVWKAVARPKPRGPRRTAAEQPLFGTYGFLRPEDASKADSEDLKLVDGLGGIVRRPITREPVIMPVGEVEKFVRLEAEGFFDQTRSRPPKIKRMDQVRITSGFFEGKRGFVSLTVGERVKVLLDMLGQVEVPSDQVELVA